MNRQFFEFYRCPTDAVRFVVDEGVSPKPGYFRFGKELTCYGATSAVPAASNPYKSLGDARPAVRVKGGQVNLPFDADQVADCLRYERYTNGAHPGTPRLGVSQMVRNFYYLCRPLMSVAVRSVLQRIYLRGQLNNPFPVWPVDRSVDRLFEEMMKLALKSNGNVPIPFVWFWPEGAKAAFILTHDVEDEIGKAFCTSLMDIDDEYGFKAAFQIVPEDRYGVEPEFLNQFRSRNFEICIHDLNHDGNLYRDRSEFKRRAQRINDYCKKFDTQGFRAGVLYRNLSWYGDYQFSYDMSVPNVAHLDPQGGGCCTVMPYFIGKILELPVTATQDYSLFYILRERSINLWKQQLRTIIEGHGLISVIIHPDYMREPEQQRMFRDLLGHVRTLCATEGVWATLPSKINSWWRQRKEMELVSTPEGWRITGRGSEKARIAYASLEGDSLVYSFTAPESIARDRLEVQSDRAFSGHPKALPVAELPESGPLAPALSSGAATLPVSLETSANLRGKPAPQTSRRPLRVAMVSYSFYEKDNRVLRYASTLAKRGDYVDVFALRCEGRPVEEEMDGVHVHRLQERTRDEKNRFSYAWRIFRFLAHATVEVGRYDLRNHYDLLHIHSVPDFMVFSALLPKLRGTPVILDIHDILPEFYASKFSASHDSATFRALVGVERASCRFADHVIIANDIWRDRLLSRRLPAEKCTVVLNFPDRSIFSRSGLRSPQPGKFLMLYPGSLNDHQGIDIAIRAFAKISKRAPQAEFHIYGEGPSKQGLLDLIGSLGVESQVKIPASRSLQEIAQVMETADLGVVPKRKDNFGNEAFSTKILEFMAMGVPVIVSDTLIDKFYFDDSVVKFFTSGDEDDLARCMLEMMECPAERQRLVDHANRYVLSVDWTARQHEYLELVDRLAARTTV